MRNNEFHWAAHTGHRGLTLDGYDVADSTMVFVLGDCSNLSVNEIDDEIEAGGRASSEAANNTYQQSTTH